MQNAKCPSSELEGSDDLGRGELIGILYYASQDNAYRYVFWIDDYVRVMRFPHDIGWH
jgi:hypothetical protein